VRRFIDEATLKLKSQKLLEAFNAEITSADYDIIN
jgi:hypothetical protein